MRRVASYICWQGIENRWLVCRLAALDDTPIGQVADRVALADTACFEARCGARWVADPAIVVTDIFELRMGVQYRTHVFGIIAPVGRQPPGAAGHEYACDFIGKMWLHDAAFVVTF